MIFPVCIATYAKFKTREPDHPEQKSPVLGAVTSISTNFILKIIIIKTSKSRGGGEGDPDCECRCIGRNEV